MGLNLKKLLEGAKAQINTRDGGKTFSTVMRNAQPGTTPPPGQARPSGIAQTVNRAAGAVLRSASPVSGVGNALSVGLPKLSTQLPKLYNTVKDTSLGQAASNPVTRFVDRNVISPAVKTQSNVGNIAQGRNPYSGSMRQQGGQALQDAVNVAGVLPIGKAAGLAARGLPAIKQGLTQGAKIGAGFGAAQGLSTSLQNEQNLPRSLKTIGMGTALGAGIGAGAGVAAPVIGAAARQVKPVMQQGAQLARQVDERLFTPEKTVAQGGYLRLPGNEEVNMPLYHGSNTENIKDFDLSNASRLPGRNLLGKGVYATDNVQRAEKYGRNVYRVDVPAKAKLVDLEAQGQWADKERILGLRNELAKLGVPARLKNDGTLDTQLGRIDGANPDSIYRAITNSRRFKADGKLEQALDNLGINGLESGDARVLFNANSAKPSPYISPQPTTKLDDAAEARVFASNPMNQKSDFTGAPPLPVIKTKRVPLRDKAFRSTRSIIERQGESGKQLAGMLRDSRDTQELYLGQLEKQLPTVTKLARKGRNALVNKDFENFVEATQGLAKPKNPMIMQAVKEWQGTHPGIRDRAVAAGLEVGDLGPEYYPHFIDYDRVFKDKNTYNQAINHLVESGQAPSQEEAIKLLNYAKDTSRNRQFGNLEASRLVDLPFYDKTPNSLISYLGGSAKRIANTETFGAKDEKALRLITKAGQQGYDTEATKNAYDVAVGAKQYNPTTDKILKNVRRYNTTTRLGLGALTNISQNVNTGIVTGHLRTAGAMLKQLSPKNREFVQNTAVVADAVLNDIRTQSGYESFSSKVLGKAINKITAPGFGAVEKFNRSVSAVAGRDYANSLASRGKVDVLRKLGVKGEIGRKLTEEQQIQAARRIVEKTQFKVDPQDLPGWADSPWGKLVSQFRTFSYNQGKFISNEVLKPAAKGNVLPLSRLLAAIPLGYASYEGRRLIAGRPEEENPTKRVLAAFQAVGGAGLPFDIYNSINPIGSKYLPSDRRTTMALGAIGGPTAGLFAQAVGAVSETSQRKNLPEDEERLEGKVAIKGKEDYTDLTPISRFGLQQIPIVGTPIKNRLLPFKKESEADAGKTPGPEGSALAAAQNIEKESKQRAKDLKASLSEEDYALSKLSKDEQQDLIDQGTVSGEKIDGLNNYVKGKRNELGFDDSEGSRLSSNLPKDFDKSLKDTLRKYEKMKTTEREDYLYANPGAEFELENAKYQKDLANGSLKSPAEKIKRQNAITKIQAGKDTPKEIRELYGLAKDDVEQLITSDKNGSDIAKKLLAYDDALVKSKVASKHKFRDKYGNERFSTAKAKGGSGGKKGKGGKGLKKLPGSPFAQATSNTNASLQALVRNAKVTRSKKK